MPRGNPNNLVQNKEQTPEERRENAKKAGIASGQSRREKRYFQESLQKLLNGKYYIGDEENRKQLGGYDALAQAMILKAINGDVQAFKEIRDTIGEKPKDTVGFESESLSGIKISFVNKSNPNKKKETDPKIVGDYTPPSNVEDS